MTKKYKILAKFIKDASSETADIETFLFVKENLSKYQLNIDITSKALKNKLVEVNTTLKFEDKEQIYFYSAKRRQSHNFLVRSTLSSGSNSPAAFSVDVASTPTLSSFSSGLPTGKHSLNGATVATAKSRGSLPISNHLESMSLAVSSR